METQELNLSEPCPQGIVGQLLEIAKLNDAMSEIGGATSWRWQEGIITRMPKTKTVAKILTKAFGTDNPNFWISKTTGDLKSFIERAFVCEFKKILEIEPSNIFEAAIVLSLIDSNGIKFEEMVYRLSFFKYAETFSDDEYFTDLDEDLILSLNKDWAEAFLNNFLKKYSVPLSEDGYYCFPGGCNYPHSKMIRYQNEIMTLRHKVVTNNSNFDMWKVRTVALTDEEMIEIEYKIIEYYNKLSDEVLSRTSRSFRERDTLKTRLISFCSVTMPKGKKEELKWKN